MRSRSDAAGIPRLPEIIRDDLEIDGFARTLAEIEQQLLDPDGFGFCVVSGIPVADADEEEIVRRYWIIGLQLGVPVTQSKRAGLHRAGSTRARGERAPRLQVGRRARLPQRLPAGLLCIRPAPEGGESALVSTAAVHDAMLAERPDLLAACYHPLPWGRLDEQADGEATFSMQPIFAADAGRFGAFFNRTSSTMPPPSRLFPG